MDKKTGYAKVLLDAYHNGLLKIVWNTTGFSLGIAPAGKDMLSESEEKAFIEYTFSIIKIVAAMAEDKVNNNISEKDLEVAKEIYRHENDLKNHLFIKKNSKINCFRFLETQIISYRSDEDPRKIEVSSAIIKMMLENDDDNISYSFEISKRDLEEIIGKLTELKVKMDSI